MRIGSTAIEAIVKGAPTSAIPPKVSPAVARATPSGSSRARTRKTSARVAAMMSKAATSNTTIARLMLCVRSETTTGAPVTA